jgi:peptide/nickel transport system substrate-binding protein
MSRIGKFAGALAMAVAVFGPAAAHAQQSKDTLRIALNEFVSGINPYDLTLDELSRVYRKVYRTLISRDERNATWVPELAKSWRMVDNETLEFELRDDVTFHSGNKFTPADVIYTVNYVADPQSKIPGKSRFTFLKNAEQTGPNTVRIHTTGVVGTALESIAYDFYILDSKVHAALPDKSAYGRVSASGAGIYRVVKMDPRGNTLLERFDGFVGDRNYHRAPVKNIELIPMPERQTQVAQMLVQGVDVLRNVEPETATYFVGNPEIEMTTVPSGSFLYLLLDAAGRSGVPAMKDQRVRQAIAMAIDRAAIAHNLVTGADKEKLPDAICFATTVACSVSRKPYDFDPAAAKKLLADAGYGEGLTLPFFVHAPYKQIGEAIAQQLQKIGIRTNIQLLPISVYTKKRGDGELTMFLGARPTATYPETTAVFTSLFGGARDYAKDPIIDKAIAQAEKTFDIAERAKILQTAVDRNNEQVYVLPISTMPTVLLHGKNVKVQPGIMSMHDAEISDFSWK